MLGLSEGGEVPDTYGIVGAEIFEGPEPAPPLKALAESAADVAPPNWLDRYKQHSQTKKGDKGKALELVLRAGAGSVSDPFAATLYQAVTNPGSETAVADLAKVAASGHPLYAPTAAAFLQHVGPSEARAARAALKLLEESTDPQVHTTVVECLQQIGPTPLIHVRELIGVLGGKHAALSMWAVQCLGLIGPPARKAIDPLFRSLKTAQREQRLAVVDALGAIGREPDRVVPLLAQALKNQNPEYRARAAAALARFGPAAAPAAGLLTALLKDGSAAVRETAERALKAVNPPLGGAAAEPSGQGAAPESMLVPCSCGKKLRVKTSLAGRKVKCPGCGGVVPVPMPGQSFDEKVCPVCQATVPAAAILCVLCGIDFRTGKPLGAAGGAETAQKSPAT